MSDKREPKRLNLDDFELDPQITSDEVAEPSESNDERLRAERPPHHEEKSP